MSLPSTARAGRWCAFTAIALTLAAVVGTLAQADPQRRPLVAALVVALLWGLGGALAVALLPLRGGAEPDEPAAAPAGVRLGTLMQLGGVPDQVARMTSAIAAAAGPVALVVPPGREVPVGLDPAVVVLGPDVDRHDQLLARFHRRCDAVLFASARALPAPGAVQAAAHIAEGADWVVGRAESLNRDRFGPIRRELLDARLRRRSSAAGLWCWEPDATVVATRLLREHPVPAGRPLGTWLRARAAEGAVGTAVDTTLTRRAAPVAAEGYWPDTTARQRAGVADLCDAALDRSLPARARTIAAGLAARALSGWSVLCWLAVLVLLAAGSPVRDGGGPLALGIGAALGLRWLAPHLAAGTRPSPLADLVAGLYALPGSLSATGSALRRRVRAPRHRVSTRPLVWLALVATAAAASVVLTARPGDGTARLAAAVAAALLVLLWVFTVRSLVERSWQRVGFRIPVDLPASVTGAEGDHGEGAWRLVDGAPAGFGLSGPPTGLVRGDEITVHVHRGAAADLVLHGTVAGTRHGGPGTELLGAELRTAEPGAAAWAQLLIEAADSGTEVAGPVVDEQPPERGWSRWADRLTIGLVVGASVAVLCTLALVLTGLRPLVIRSTSMEPTYHVGDVVLVADELAGEIREGQVVTRYDAPQAADSLTHRVRSVSRSGDVVRVETRGDANEGSEFWAAPAGRQVGVVVASVPAIGLPLVAVRSSGAVALVLAAVVVALIAVLLRPLWSRPRDETLSNDDALPMEPSTTDSGERS